MTSATKTSTKTSGKSSGKSKSSSKTQITDYVNDLVSVTKDVVDDVVDIAGRVEKSARVRGKEARDAVLPSEKDLKDLRKRTRDLTDAAERLISLRGSAKKSAKGEGASS